MNTELIIIITLLVLAGASLAMNVLQWCERKAERKELNRFIAEGARLESELLELKSAYENEQLHVRWAKGRIKDQQCIIEQLKAGVAPKPRKVYKPRKEGDQ